MIKKLLTVILLTTLCSCEIKEEPEVQGNVLEKAESKTKAHCDQLHARSHPHFDWPQARHGSFRLDRKNQSRFNQSH